MHLSAAPEPTRVVGPEPNDGGYPSGSGKWLERALWLSDRLMAWMPTPGIRRVARAAEWDAGVSIVVSQREGPGGVAGEYVQGVLRIASEVPEPIEVISTIPGHGYVAGLRQALRAARFDWIYLLDAGMEMGPGTLTEALRWRAPYVFAVGSRIVGGGSSGWNDAVVTGDVVVPFSGTPDESGRGRGNLFADGRAALFRRSALRAVLAYRDPYFAPRWNDVEWGIRAWRARYEVLFCPDSRVYLRREAPAQCETARRRDQLQVDLRNSWTGLPREHLMEMVCQPDDPVHASLWKPVNICRVFLSRLRAYAAPVRELPWSHLRRKWYPEPWTRRDPRPTILVATPYALYPPTHGGAHRIHHLLECISRRYRVILLSDEGQLYSDAAAAYFTHLGAVHFVGGRKDTPSDEPARIARMRSHSHEKLGEELSRILAVYGPDLVQIEYVELALLITRRAYATTGSWWNGTGNPGAQAERLAIERGRPTRGSAAGQGARPTKTGFRKQGRTPWILTLHDVLLSGAVRPSEEDRFEVEWMKRFDHLIACCEEDRSLLGDAPVSVVPNGAATGRSSYASSAGLRDLLFLGPFRYQPNWDGIQEFLGEAYPALQARIPAIRVHILGGVDAPLRTARCQAFQQDGVCVHDHVDDVAPWLQACALTINPIRNNRGSCLKVIQSLAAGRVCISTREGARGFLNSGLTGLVVVETVAEFADAIVRLLNDDAERLKLEAPEAGQIDGHSWERAADAQMAVYQQLMVGRRLRHG